ncbi:unnamed protein product, partial [Didymodactylos carnosus]
QARDKEKADVDFVVCLKLNFWPPDIQPFLKRLQARRESFYELIKNEYMHVVPKWSKLTPASSQEFEFRYSFSAIELILAKNRTQKEQILNGIARSIYYKYSYKRTELTSYFVKTTVLWMCETLMPSADHHLTNSTFARRWIDYACQLLHSGVCPHYFLENINLFESYTRQQLNNAYEILKTDVNIHDNSMLTTSEQLKYNFDFDSDFEADISEKDGAVIDGCQRIEEFASNSNSQLELKEDYKKLKRIWPHLDQRTSITDMNEEDHEMFAVIEMFVIFFLLSLSDGTDEQNWLKWKKLFLDYNDQCTSQESICDENISSQTICQFAMDLTASINLIKSTYDNCIKPKATTESLWSFHQNTASPIALNLRQSYQCCVNLLNDALNSDTQSNRILPLMNNILQSSPTTILENHPQGPVATHGLHETEQWLKLFTELAFDSEPVKSMLQQTGLINEETDQTISSAKTAATASVESQVCSIS